MDCDCHAGHWRATAAMQTSHLCPSDAADYGDARGGQLGRGATMRDTATLAPAMFEPRGPRLPRCRAMLMEIGEGGGRGTTRHQAVPRLERHIHRYCMFRTFDSNELPRARHSMGATGSLWRAVDVVGRRPWILATFADGVCGSAQRTISIAWDSDLADLVTRADAPQLLQLLCLVPDEQGVWAAWSISEIFAGDAGGVTGYVLRCVEGREICADLEGSDPLTVVNRRRIARVPAPGA